MAVARLMNWFYSEIDNIALDPFYEEPSKPLNKWTKSKNSTWLKVRGFDVSGLSASSLKDRVSDSMNATGGPPSVLEAPKGCSANVTALTAALSAMVSKLMTRTITDMHIADIERHIKLFLSAYEEFDLANHKSSDAPSWVTSYNFCCLSNYPALIQQFGPLHNL